MVWNERYTDGGEPTRRTTMSDTHTMVREQISVCGQGPPELQHHFAFPGRSCHSGQTTGRERDGPVLFENFASRCISSSHLSPPLRPETSGDGGGGCLWQRFVAAAHKIHLLLFIIVRHNHMCASTIIYTTTVRTPHKFQGQRPSCPPPVPASMDTQTGRLSNKQ